MMVVVCLLIAGVQANAQIKSLLKEKAKADAAKALQTARDCASKSENDAQRAEAAAKRAEAAAKKAEKAFELHQRK
mgnify:CR=1 FL=1